jgi:hypothetical protein
MVARTTDSIGEEHEREGKEGRGGVVLMELGCDKIVRLKAKCKRSVGWSTKYNKGRIHAIVLCLDNPRQCYVYFSVLQFARQIGSIECAEISTIDAGKR